MKQTPENKNILQGRTLFVINEVNVNVVNDNFRIKNF